MDQSAGALAGIEVLELGHHIAASYCTKLLADLGAHVSKLEGPCGDPLRNDPPMDPTEPEPTGGIFHYLNANKDGLRGDLHDPEVAEAVRSAVTGLDILVENFRPGTMEKFGLGPAELLARNPQLVYVRISNYGQTGPWRDRPASDLTLQAESGIALRLGDPGTPPASIAGRLVEHVGGTYAAAAALAALVRTRSGSPGTVVDVSLFEALLSANNPVDVLEEFLAGHGLDLPDRQRVMPGFATCRDGEVCVSTLTAQNWLDLCHLIHRPEWADRMADVQQDGADRAAFLAALTEWTRPQACVDVVETLQALRIAAAMPTDGRTMLEQPPFVARGFFVPHPGAGFVRPAAPYRLSATPVTLRSPAPSSAEARPAAALRQPVRRRQDVPDETRRLPLDGLRVVDLTGYLAGGHLTGTLAALGADVVKVESSKRPDGYRFVMTFPALGEAWWERSPLWQAQNLGKRSLSLDLTTAEGRQLLGELVTSCDVFVENFTPRVVERFGFDYEVVRRHNPRVVMVRMPAFGIEGPWRDRAGFAYNIEQVGGMAQNGWDGGPLVQPAGIVDIINAQHALVAVMAALHHRARTGQGQLIEVSQAETVACLTADQVIEYQLTGACRPRLGNRLRGCAPQGIYPTCDGRFVAVTIATDEDWVAACKELDLPNSLWDLDRRRRADEHDRLDELVAGWTHERPADEVVRRLLSAGVPAATLALLPELRVNPQLVAREYYRTMPHPVSGTHRAPRPAALFAFGDLAMRPAPTLGQHNEELLAELGLGPEAIAALERAGVVGRGLADA